MTGDRGEAVVPPGGHAKTDNPGALNATTKS